MSKQRSPYWRLMVRRSPKRRTRPPLRLDLFPVDLPDLDPIDWPRHNPADGEFLSDDQLWNALWFHLKRRPTERELKAFKHTRWSCRFGWLKYSGIKHPPTTKLPPSWKTYRLRLGDGD